MDFSDKEFLSLRSVQVLSISLALLLAIAVFVPGLGGEFILDDGINIIQNRLLYLETLSVDGLRNAAFSFHDGRGSRPIPMVSFAMDYWRAGGMHASTFKATNLAFHALTTFILIFFLRRLLLLMGWDSSRAFWVGLGLALAWAVHPLQVSSVLYVVQRMQTMATLFILLAMWCYVAMRQFQIDGVGRGRLQGVGVIIFGLLALACKEDAPLLFAYVLALELSLLRFQAADEKVSRGLKQSFIVLSFVVLFGYFFILLPQYWHWADYPGREFSSWERLLTQGRVLIMYLGQIIVPLPDNMPFLYDNYVVSRGLLKPLTTLLSILLIVGILLLAWLWRCYRPLFSFGVLLFLFGHSISSNVIPLELVFEHRNHFPLIGALIAVFELLKLVCDRLTVEKFSRLACFGVVLMLLMFLTLLRSFTWGDPVRHGEKLVELAAQSPRAWAQLGGAYYDKYKELREERYLIKAIEANETGLEHVQAPSLATNIVVYKSILGQPERDDWNLLYRMLREGTSELQSKLAVWTLLDNVRRGTNLSVEEVVNAIEILAESFELGAAEYLQLAVFVFKSADAERSLPLFLEFSQSAEANDPRVARIAKELEGVGKLDWAKEILAVNVGKM
ncbi:hypothetical protein [Gilvimarinus algae]|uniref:Glycosyltransferase RgtA/B/C/D-like domain-containing protein n=1 Tax=Gilvimarinus algae TaxID=3058037 RepID=A0ABT8THH9_9GAMM|nr:hypothetical protein [Gilvimarinus sp. SDUM040014]MDO3382823.1 hypothetical protein [Gilvimarinus sp. SDUM040014]